MNKHKRPASQAGFTVGSLVMVILLLTAVFFAYRFVKRASEDSSQQGAHLTNALTGDGTTPAGDNNSQEPEDLKSYTDQSQLWENPIRTVNVDVDPLTVTFTITLPGTYHGTCTLEIWQPGQESDKRRFVEDLKGTKTCALHVPTQELEDSSTWRFQAGYFSDDGRTYGKHAETSLRL